jgi:uncharacterized protein (TIGR02300 family)
MPPKDLGNKFVCFKCSTRFYDLKKPEPICPKCGADQRESPALKAPHPQERRARAHARPVVTEAAEEEVLTEDAELAEDDEAFEEEQDETSEDEV